MTIHRAQAGRQAGRQEGHQKQRIYREQMIYIYKKRWRMKRGAGAGGEGVSDVRRSSLLRLGEFHSVADDLDSLLLRTGSVCRGRFTVEDEHLPAPERTQHTHTHTRSHRGTQRLLLREGN